jgi:hypothetical protein
MNVNAYHKSKGLQPALTEACLVSIEISREKGFKKGRIAVYIS